MRIVDLILKKKRGEVLSREEIKFFIDGYVSGDIPDYQVSALLLAVYFRGMDKQETTDLTLAMVDSGDKVDLSSIKGIKVDKHSTGGVADTATLIVGPLVAASGGLVAKMSGRGLGHTGGTLDKLESIPGMNISQTMKRFAEIVNTCGVSVIGQTGNLVPADKKLYALRDVTGTVDNVSLIAGSVMSKKLASGSDKIVLDVKTGSGAFMKDVESASELAKMMVDIGTLAGKETIALVKDMNKPLGNAVGNVMEE
ncbi:MAG: thymidine phosphorylase, partial [Spirochaetales bacterium]|nr:thymidine phosphorylase [Spirochaetales bacterium]